MEGTSFEEMIGALVRERVAEAMAGAGHDHPELEELHNALAVVRDDIDEAVRQALESDAVIKLACITWLEEHLDARLEILLARAERSVATMEPAAVKEQISAVYEYVKKVCRHPTQYISFSEFEFLGMSPDGGYYMVSSMQELVGRASGAWAKTQALEAELRSLREAVIDRMLETANARTETAEGIDEQLDALMDEATAAMEDEDLVAAEDL